VAVDARTYRFALLPPEMLPSEHVTVVAAVVHGLGVVGPGGSEEKMTFAFTVTLIAFTVTLEGKVTARSTREAFAPPGPDSFVKLVIVWRSLFNVTTCGTTN